jgi:cellulose synthase/poly-beta-1,6-N-acetylglucosamine synthase-like glycosyltransferase
MDPLVTVIIPVRNEARYIERCLYSVAAQDYPRERIETLVIDGRSEDHTREIVTRFAAESTLEVRLIDNPARKAAAAMNIGLREASGDIIVRIDGHAALAPDYLRRAVAALDASGADCVGGVLQSEGDTWAGRAIAAAMSSPFGVGGAAFRTGAAAGAVDTVAFGAYRRRVFEALGTFREDIDAGEDDEYNYRLRDAGGTILLLPELRATYTVRGSFAGLWRQYFAYGRAKPLVLRLHPAQTQVRQLVPAAFVAALAASITMAIFGRSGALRALAAMYTLAATIASFVLGVQRGIRLILPMMAVFPCMHIAYGSGFFAGLVGLARTLLTRAAAGAGAHQSTEASHQAD